MATTAPTPKIMPSMVSRLRSLCAKRLASPIFNSGRTCPNIYLFPHEFHAGGEISICLGTFFPIFNSGRTCPNIYLFPPRHGTHGVAIGFLLALILLGVLVEIGRAHV